MEYITQFIELFLHLDKSLSSVIQTYGSTTYIILFLVILCETGLVVLPFLPGDSLLFAAGAFAAKGDINIATLFMILCVAAILGDSINYEVGRLIGPRIAQREKSRYVNKEHIDKTHQFYEKYGAKTIIIARFIPIIRTFAPFVAGLGTMSYKKFLQYNVIGGVAWVAICLFAGYLFGNIPLVKQNFTAVIFAIIIVSILPAVIEYIRHRSITKAA
ncbi:MAG: DedA family protein [Methylococcales bacterium]|nr:MAG: DedA family protein [Methylococcales bacterium]